MALKREDTTLSDYAEVLFSEGLSGLGRVVEKLINEVMRIERERYLQASAYERTENRIDYANGFKPKQLRTRLGELNLLVPQVREGKFYPCFLERGIRSERALKISIAEMYLQGVSTRKVTAILEELCGLEVTSSEVSRAAKLLDEEFTRWRNRPLGKHVYLILDARYEKVRIDNSVRDAAILVAYGIDEAGIRSILGVSIALSEQEVHWRHFLESLLSRGLHGIEMITSDAHSGLKAALRAVFPCVPWQRCQFHLQQNAQSYIPKISMKKEVAEDIRTIFNAPHRVEAERFLKEFVTKYEKKASKLSQWMEKNIPEGFSIFNFPKKHQLYIRTSNMAERVNREIRKRTQVVNIFPSLDSCERLITGVLIEISESWETGSPYLSMR